MRVYFDTSAFAKRYIDEDGTAEVLTWCDRASELALSVIAVPEIVAAFRRLLREGRITDKQYLQIKGDFVADIVDALVCDTTPQVIQKAVAAIEARPLRGMDAIHIGAALTCAADAFVSADERQFAAASHLGLHVIAL